MFSRAVALNDWLKNWSDENDLIFIDNLVMLSSASLFNIYGNQLNKFGALKLSNQIRSHVRHLL